jgi:hypothetical protein
MGRAAAVVGGAVRGDAAQLRYFSLNSPITLNQRGWIDIPSRLQNPRPPHLIPQSARVRRTFILCRPN